MITPSSRAFSPAALAPALVLGLALFAFAAPVSGQDLQEKLEAKLAEPFLKNGKWFTDYDEALAEARRTNKIIFGYFTRSYAP